MSDRIRWDAETDVIIVGYGATGAVAAITIAEAGGEVLILEKAPEAGGSSAVATGGMRYTTDAAGGARYIKFLGLGSLDDATAQSFAAEWVRLKPWLLERGARLVKPQPTNKPFANEGAPDMEQVFFESPDGYVLGCGRDLFAFLDGLVRRRGIPVRLNTPVKRLVQDTVTKEIRGVLAESGGREIAVKARKAVVLTCGGFNANPEMIATYITEAPVKIHATGSPYCTGDGLKMVMDVGADLWHMDGIEYATHSFKAPEFPAAFWLQPKGQSWIHVNRAGRRFHDERTDYGHTKKFHHVFEFNQTPQEPLADWPNSPWYMVFDEKERRAGPIGLTERRSGASPYITYNAARQIWLWSKDNLPELEKGWIKKADSLAELARIVNVDPAGLQATVAQFNGFAAAGRDPDFRRDPRFLLPIDTPPFYAIECCVGIINTQGGPRHNEKGQVLAAYDGVPIPHLYSGGEFGSIFSFLYPGAMNLVECFTSGIICGRNAVAEPAGRD
jgi:succinate dehydrogenase/fumarate reductase flavoprotein subunit